MNEFGNVRLDDPGYTADVDDIASSLEGGGACSVAFAANSTRKHVMLVHWGSTDFPGERPAGFTEQDAIFVGIANGKAAWLPLTEADLDPGYVAQYLGHDWGWHDTSDPEDEPFVRFLNDVRRALLAELAMVSGHGDRN